MDAEDVRVHVAFDLDGVLLDSETDLSWLDRALDAALREFDLPATPENRRKLYPVTVREFREVADELGIDPGALWEARSGHYLDEKVGAIERGELRPFPDVDALYDLRPEHDLHVVSNSPREVVDAFVRAYGYEDLFSVRIGRGTDLADLDRLKPDPHFYRLLDERAGGEEYLYVGDADSDREFAERAGMDFFHLTRDDDGIADLHEVVERIRRRS